MYAQYFVTLVKESNGDFTLVVVPRGKGLSTKHITLSGSTTAGTAFVEFDDVEVPLNMVVGERGKGFKYVVSNFNHEVGSHNFLDYLEAPLRHTRSILIHYRDCSSPCRPLDVHEFVWRTPSNMHSAARHLGRN